MNRIDEYDQLYCLVASLSETTNDLDLMEAFNLLAVLHQPTHWTSTDHLDQVGKRAAATSLLNMLQASPADPREALDLNTLAALIGDPR